MGAAELGTSSKACGACVHDAHVGRAHRLPESRPNAHNDLLFSAAKSNRERIWGVELNLKCCRRTAREALLRLLIVGQR